MVLRLVEVDWSCLCTQQISSFGVKFLVLSICLFIFLQVQVPLNRIVVILRLYFLSGILITSSVLPLTPLICVFILCTSSILIWFTPHSFRLVVLMSDGHDITLSLNKGYKQISRGSILNERIWPGTVCTCLCVCVIKYIQYSYYPRLTSDTGITLSCLFGSVLPNSWWKDSVYNCCSKLVPTVHTCAYRHRGTSAVLPATSPAIL